MCMLNLAFSYVYPRLSGTLSQLSSTIQDNGNEPNNYISCLVERFSNYIKVPRELSRFHESFDTGQCPADSHKRVSRSGRSFMTQLTRVRSVIRIAMLRQCWKYCENIVSWTVTVFPQCSGNIVTKLWQYWGNIILQCWHIVTTLPECCVNIVLWSANNAVKTFRQYFHNIIVTLKMTQSYNVPIILR